MCYVPSWPLEWDMNGTVCQTIEEQRLNGSKTKSLKLVCTMLFTESWKDKEAHYVNGMSFNAEPESLGNNANHVNP